MAFSRIRKWKFESDLKTTLANRQSNGLERCDIGIITDTKEMEQLNQLIQQISHDSKVNCIQFLCYSDVKSKEIQDSVYFKSDVSWAGVPNSASINDYLSYKYDRLFVFLDKIADHNTFILEQVKAEYIYANYVAGIEKYAKFMIDTKTGSLLDKYKMIQKTLKEISKK